jgi:hypothetical protein
MKKKRLVLYQKKQNYRRIQRCYFCKQTYNTKLYSLTWYEVYPLGRVPYVPEKHDVLRNKIDNTLSLECVDSSFKQSELFDQQAQEMRQEHSICQMVCLTCSICNCGYDCESQEKKISAARGVDQLLCILPYIVFCPKCQRVICIKCEKQTLKDVCPHCMTNISSQTPQMFQVHQIPNSLDSPNTLSSSKRKTCYFIGQTD